MTSSLWAPIMAALRPLAEVEAAPEWNRAQLAGLLGPRPLRRAAVLVGIIERPQGPQVLLTVRAGTLRQHAGQVSFPGGAIDVTDADAGAAALREAAEEIGLRAAQAEMLGWLDPLATISRFRVLPLVARVDAGFIPRIDRAEVARVFEAPLDYLLSPRNLRRVPTLYQGRELHVVEYAPLSAQMPRIWGATAMVLQNFIERLHSSMDGDGG